MTSHYEQDGDELIQVGEECQSCGSQDTEYDRYYQYWKCEACSTVWGDAIEESEDDQVMPAKQASLGSCALSPDDPDYEYVRYISGLKMD